MIAVHLHQGKVTVRSTPRPRRARGCALIRLRVAGICNTDLELQRGYYGFSGYPGHEFVGEVVACDSPRWLGRRVVGEINLNCGECQVCVSEQLGRHCAKRTVLGIVKHPGVFREFFTLPESNLHEVPAHLSDDDAVFAEPVAAACEILEQVHIPHHTPVAVLGDGKLGLLVAQVLEAHGARVYLFGKHAEKLAIAQQAGIDVRPADAAPNAAFRFTVEATGSAAGLAQAVRMTRPRGTVIMKSTVHGPVKLDTAPVVVNELTLVGSRCGQFQPALDLLGSGMLRLREMITARYPLGDAPAAFRRAAAKGVLKVLLENQ